MVAGREAWSSWARQCGRPWLVTEHGSFPGGTGLLQGGGGTTTQTGTLGSLVGSLGFVGSLGSLDLLG